MIHYEKSHAETKLELKCGTNYVGLNLVESDVQGKNETSFVEMSLGKSYDVNYCGRFAGKDHGKSYGEMYHETSYAEMYHESSYVGKYHEMNPVGNCYEVKVFLNYVMRQVLKNPTK